MVISKENFKTGQRSKCIGFNAQTPWKDTTRVNRGRDGGLIVVCWTTDRAVKVWALAGVNVLNVFLGKTQLSQCLSPPRSINGYWRTVRATWQNAGWWQDDGLASHPGGVAILLVSFMLRKPEQSSRIVGQFGPSAALPTCTATRWENCILSLGLNG